MRPRLLMAGIAAAAALGMIDGALAQEARLKAVSAFADGTTFTRNFQRFIDVSRSVG